MDLAAVHPGLSPVWRYSGLVDRTPSSSPSLYILALAIPPKPSRGMWVWVLWCVFLTFCNCSPFTVFIYVFRVGRRGECVCEGLRFFASSKHSSLSGFDMQCTSLAHAWLPPVWKWVQLLGPLAAWSTSCLVHCLPPWVWWHTWSQRSQPCSCPF